MNKQFINKWLWWRKGECVVEVIRTGHFPNTVMVKLPDDRVVEAELSEMENHNGANAGSKS